MSRPLLAIVLTMLFGMLQISCSNKSFNAVSTDGPAISGDPGGGPTGGTTGTGGTLGTGGTISTGGTIGQDCHPILTTLNVPIKLLFVVDISGSNLEADDGSPGSDPNKNFRGGSITQFFADYVRYSNFYWGFITFNNSSTRSLISPAFSNNGYSMQNAINAFYNTPDIGTTPFVPAIQAAKNAIASDTTRTANTKYIVVFLSDGLPVPDVNTSTLVSEVQKVVNTVPGQVTFNTIYYGIYNPTASSRLSSMANAGGGLFLDTNANPSGRDFQIDHVINVPGVECNPPN